MLRSSSRSSLEGMSVANLRALMAMLHVSAEGCLEKQDMVTRLCESGKLNIADT